MKDGSTPDKVVVRDLCKVFPATRGKRDRGRRGRTDAKAPNMDADGATVAVDNVSFSVRAGEIFVVMGLSGSGKSTLIRCINRLVQPSAGEVQVDGEDIIAASDQRLRRIRLTKAAMVFQHFALFPHKTVAENVAYGLKVRNQGPRERRDRALATLAQVGLGAWADAPPSHLSGGMQQRVGLARALAVNPEVLLMDEPFSALDPLIRRDMQTELIALQRHERKTIVFITHDLHEALTLGDRIAIMRDGRFVQIGTPQDIVTSPADDYVAAFTKDVDRSRVLTARAAMRPPLTLKEGRDGIATAEARLYEAGARGVHVVDDDDRPVGLILASGMCGGVPPGDDLSAVMRRDFACAGPTTTLAELYPSCATGLPIAVVDADGRLVGSLDPLDVFALVAGKPPMHAACQGTPATAGASA